MTKQELQQALDNVATKLGQTFATHRHYEKEVNTTEEAIKESKQLLQRAEKERDAMQAKMDAMPNASDMTDAERKAWPQMKAQLDKFIGIVFREQDRQKMLTERLETAKRYLEQFKKENQEWAAEMKSLKSQMANARGERRKVDEQKFAEEWDQIIDRLSELEDELYEAYTDERVPDTDPKKKKHMAQLNKEIAEWKGYLKKLEAEIIAAGLPSPLKRGRMQTNDRARKDVIYPDTERIADRIASLQQAINELKKDRARKEAEVRVLMEGIKGDTAEINNKEDAILRLKSGADRSSEGRAECITLPEEVWG
jgi:chromosome segregation ATPase